MYTVTQTRTYPIEFSITKPNSNAVTVCSGEDAKETAQKVANFMNSQEIAAK